MALDMLKKYFAESRVPLFRKPLRMAQSYCLSVSRNLRRIVAVIKIKWQKSVAHP
jgi:hypothetical protein